MGSTHPEARRQSTDDAWVLVEAPAEAWNRTNAAAQGWVRPRAWWSWSQARLLRVLVQRPEDALWLRRWLRVGLP